MPELARNSSGQSSAEFNERLHRFSHDLKNKLGGLWQALRLLKDLPDGPERDELIVFAERSYFGGAQAVEQLMEDLDVPRGISVMTKDEVDLPLLVKRCIDGVEFRTEKKQQTLEVDVDPSLVIVGDRELLRNILEALLSNASKFSSKGSKILVSASPDGPMARITVEDHGVGLSKKDLGDVFTRYALLSSRSTDGESQARGTLARVRQWVKAHEGEITANSEGPGKGARFTVRLPLK